MLAAQFVLQKQIDVIANTRNNTPKPYLLLKQNTGDTRKADDILKFTYRTTIT